MKTYDESYVRKAKDVVLLLHILDIILQKCAVTLLPKGRQKKKQNNSKLWLLLNIALSHLQLCWAPHQTGFSWQRPSLGLLHCLGFQCSRDPGRKEWKQSLNRAMISHNS